MNTFYSIFISIMAFFLVVMISYTLDNMVFTDPNPSEDKLLTVIKLFIEVSMICIITFLILSNVKEISMKYNIQDSNNLLIPIIIAWIIVINYYFKNKLFGKFNILFKDLVHLPNSTINTNKTFQNKLEYSNNSTYSNDNNNSNNSDNRNNSNNVNNVNTPPNNYKDKLNNYNSNTSDTNNSSSGNSNNSNNISIKNNKNIFTRHHNKGWFKSNFDITDYYPELMKQNNNIRSGKYEYVEVNNLKN